VYARDEIGVNVLRCTCLSTDDATVKSYKVSIELSDRDKMLDAEVWPENIRVRKFFRPRNNGRSD
jgi:hypothetical protein